MRNLDFEVEDTYQSTEKNEKNNEHTQDEGEIQKVYEFKRFLDRLNDDDAIAVPHEDAQATLGDTNDPFTSISMSKDFADKDIAANDAY
ncbi:hypothetical protein Tco_0535909 [Tanacetum coccineum]